MEESVTLVTAKNQHCCWKARTRVRKTRMCGGFIRFRRRDDFGEGTNDKLSLGLSSLEVLSEKVCKFSCSPSLLLGKPNKREGIFAMKN